MMDRERFEWVCELAKEIAAGRMTETEGRTLLSEWRANGDATSTRTVAA